MKPISCSIAAMALVLTAMPAMAEYKPDQTLVDAATDEGKVVIYTANQLESEQQLAHAFNERFPGIEVEVVRAPGSKLVARVEAESSANVLGADIMEFSDVGLALTFDHLFADFAPPNADEYPEAIRAVSPKLWPKTSWGYVIAYNSALVKTPPSSWKELTDPNFAEKLGWIPAGAGGTTWTLSMFQRKVLGEKEWSALAAKSPTMFPSDAPLLDAVIRGEVRVAPLKTNTILPALDAGAPVGIVYPAEGVPVTVSAAGISAAARHPNAARLFLSWILSDEGQGVWVKTSGGMSVLDGAAMPQGAEAGKTQVWLPNLDEYRGLRDSWVTEWNDTFNYRQ